MYAVLSELRLTVHVLVRYVVQIQKCGCLTKIHETASTSCHDGARRINMYQLKYGKTIFDNYTQNIYQHKYGKTILVNQNYNISCTTYRISILKYSSCINNILPFSRFMDQHFGKYCMYKRCKTASKLMLMVPEAKKVMVI